MKLQKSKKKSKEKPSAPKVTREFYPIDLDSPYVEGGYPLDLAKELPDRAVIGSVGVITHGGKKERCNLLYDAGAGKVKVLARNGQEVPEGTDLSGFEGGLRITFKE